MQFQIPVNQFALLISVIEDYAGFLASQQHESDWYKTRLQLIQALISALYLQVGKE